MKYGLRTPDLGKSIAAKLSVNRMLKQQLGFGKGLLPNRKKAKYNKKYSKRVRKVEDIKGQRFTTQSDRVKDIQKKLKKLGVYKGNITGLLDINTINAIKRFQQKAGIDVSGILDFKTLIELNKADEKKSQEDR